MAAHIIGFLLQNLPALLFVVALVIAAARHRHGPLAERFLSWILLLPIGITGLWAGAFHVFFPATAAKLIGWDMSPFQLEVGMADLAIGATACIAFWRDLPPAGESRRPAQPHRQSEDDDDHEDDQETPASYRIVLVVDCFPRRRSEDDDEHEGTRTIKETPASYPIVIVV